MQPSSPLREGSEYRSPDASSPTMRDSRDGLERDPGEERPSSEQWRSTLDTIRDSVTRPRRPMTASEVRRRVARNKPALDVGAISRNNCPLTLRLHLSKNAMENEVIESRKHKKFVEAARSCVDCKPPAKAAHYAKRLRTRKEAMPDVELPLAFKHGFDNLGLWTLRKQVQADDKMIARALPRVDCSAPKSATHFAKWKKKQRRAAEEDMGLRPHRQDKRTKVKNAASVQQDVQEEPYQASLSDSEGDATADALRPGRGRLTGRPLSSMSRMRASQRQRPSSSLGIRAAARPHTAPGIRSVASSLDDAELQKQVVEDCERLTLTPAGSMLDGGSNCDISIATSDTGGSWSKELYLRLLNEGD